ncbi:UDP-GlcNAc:undecaprenyl-phosphate GlcNAc-1-phosphate transferase, partial [Desulforhopalus singaporensis]
IYLTQSASSSMPPVCALLILAVPITDTVVIMTKRGLQGKSPFKADKRHLHHILISYGMSKKNAVKTIVSLCVLFSAISLSGIIYKVPENVLFAIFAAYFIIYTAASFKILFFARVTRHYLNNGYIGAVKKYSAIFTGILVITTMLFLACQ